METSSITESIQILVAATKKLEDSIASTKAKIEANQQAISALRNVLKSQGAESRVGQPQDSGVESDDSDYGWLGKAVDEALRELKGRVFTLISLQHTITEKTGKQPLVSTLNGVIKKRLDKSVKKVMEGSGRKATVYKPI